VCVVRGGCGVLHTNVDGLVSSAGTYPLSTVVGCYCLDVLKEYINEHGVFSGAAKAQDDEGDLCIDSLQNYAAAQSLLLVAAMSVVFINFVLQRVLKGLCCCCGKQSCSSGVVCSIGVKGYLVEGLQHVLRCLAHLLLLLLLFLLLCVCVCPRCRVLVEPALARFERHDTVSHEQLSITIKVFLAQLLNTGVIVLIVHARLPNTSANDPVLSKIGMFSVGVVVPLPRVRCATAWWF